MDVNLKLLPDAVIESHARDKGAVLTQVGEIFSAAYGLDANRISESMDEREKLGSTGFGRGVAIPHCRSKDVNRPSVVLLRVANAIDFGSADAVPVSLVFGLVSPENAGATHLHALAAISRLMRDEGMIEALLEAPDKDAMFALLTNQFLRDAA